MEIIERDFMKVNQNRRLSACVLGSGVSPFPVQLYSKGWFQEVSVIEKEHELEKLKETHGEQRGLHLLSTDVTDKVEATKDAKPFDLIVDKGTLDILLSTIDGYEGAANALRWMWTRTKTPATVILVSHSPPHERVNFYLTEFWNSFRVKVIEMPSVQEVIQNPAASQSTKPSIHEFPFAIERWQEELELRSRGRMAASTEDTKQKISPGGTTLPAGELDFMPNRSFIYILSK